MRAKFPYEKRKKRVGHGPGSGHGQTATRGTKGQHSRTGSGHRRGFEGGQTPLYRRIPKRGFNRFPKKEFTVVNLERLSGFTETEITPEKLIGAGVVRKLRDGIKILGQGELKKPLRIQAHCFSKEAKKKIEAAGGETLVIKK